MQKIVQAPSEVLSVKAQPVGKIDKSVQKLLSEMEKTLLSARDPEGVGLAAPQIGKSLRIFIVKQSPRSPILTFINPVIEKFFDNPELKKPISTQSAKIAKMKKKLSEAKSASGGPKIDKGVQLEGCLSLNTIWGVVKRHDEVVLSFQDELGARHTKTYDGFIATIIQHEYDHLDGVLFPKRVLEQENKLYKSVKNKDGETEFEELEI